MTAPVRARPVHAYMYGAMYCTRTMSLLRLDDATRTLRRTRPVPRPTVTATVHAGPGLLDAAQAYGIDDLVWHLDGDVALPGPAPSMEVHVERAVAALARDQGLVL